MLLTQVRRERVPPYVFFNGVFSAAECKSIIHIARGLQPNAAVTGTPENPSGDKSVRSSQVCWLKQGEQGNWVYTKLAKLVADVQANWYPFHLSGFAEPIQLTKYLASEEGHYDWHKDMGDGEMSTRKLSLVALLSDPSKFEGGELEMFAIPGTEKKVKELSQGAVIAFPSWEMHRVSKITKGLRWSLVSWVHGPVFT